MNERLSVPSAVPATPAGARRNPSAIRIFAAAAAFALLLQGSAYAKSNGPSEWAVMAEASLRSSLQGWADAAGWTVFWDGPFDYRLRVSASFSGNFEEAIIALVRAVRLSEPGIAVTLYRGNKVVHVRTDAHGD